MRKYLVVILIVASLLFTGTCSQTAFAPAQDYPHPGLRSAHGMAYDPYNDLTVVFGGSGLGGGMGALGDTWFYNYSANYWFQHSGTSPPPRTNTAMVYCDQTNEIIMFSGQGVSDTWSFDCETQTWSEVATATNPGIHHSHGLAYDPVTNAVILFGGIGEDGMTTDDTWAFDCETREWEDLSPSVVPLARYGHVMTYDANISMVLVCCGNTWDQGHMDDTWAFDTSTNTWSELDTLGDLGNLKWAAMAYDSVQQRNILFGGQVGDTAVDETYVFDSFRNRWTNALPDTSPPPRINTGLAYDSAHEVVIMYGGLLIDETHDEWTQLEDTWVYSYTDNNWTLMDEVELTTGTTINDGDMGLVSLIIAIPVTLVVIVFIAYSLRRRLR